MANRYDEFNKAALNLFKGQLPKNSVEFRLSDHTGRKIAHLAVRHGCFPDKDSIWMLADNNGWRLAHEAVFYHTLSPRFPFWEVQDSEGQSVANVEYTKNNYSVYREICATPADQRCSVAEAIGDGVELFRNLSWSHTANEKRYPETEMGIDELVTNLGRYLDEVDIADVFTADTVSDPAPPNIFDSELFPGYKPYDSQECLILVARPHRLDSFQHFQGISEDFLLEEFNMLFDLFDCLDYCQTGEEWISLGHFFVIDSDSGVMMLENIIELISRMKVDESRVERGRRADA